MTWPRLSPTLSLAFDPEQRSFIMERSGMREWDKQKVQGCTPVCYLKYFSKKEALSTYMMKCSYFYSNIIEITQLCGFHPLTLASFSHRKDISDWIKAVWCNKNRTETSVDLSPVMSKHTQTQKLPSDLHLHGLVLFVWSGKWYQSLAFFTHQGCNGSILSFNCFVTGYLSSSRWR